MKKIHGRYLALALCIPILALYGALGCGGGSDAVIVPEAPPPGAVGMQTVSVATVGSGKVTSDPAGIDCGGVCSLQYETGSSLTLAAVPSAIWQFVGWSGDCAGSAAQLAVVVDADKSCTATFSMLPWAKSYGDAGDENGYAIRQLSDGGYLVGGYTSSFGAGDYDFFLLRTDGVGNVLLQKSLGGASADTALSLAETADGGFVVSGDSISFGAADYDLLVIKYNADGSIAWQERLDDGSQLDDTAAVIEPLAAGGYVVAGTTTTPLAADLDIWVVTLDDAGAIVLQNSYGVAANDEQVASVRPTSDGGFIVAGTSDVIAAPGTPEIIVLKLNADLSIAWQNSYDFAGRSDRATSIEELAGGGFVLAGTTETGAGDLDMWVLRLNAGGDVAWQRSYGRPLFDDSLNSIHQIASGGFIIGGDSVNQASSEGDIWLVRLDAAGAVVGQKLYGATGRDEIAYSLEGNADGSFVVVGSTAVTGGLPADLLVMRVLADGSIAFSTTSGMVTSDTAVSAVEVGGIAVAPLVLVETPIVGAAIDTLIAPVDAAAIVTELAP